jgi:Flp pilus assembly protein TadD
MCAVLIAASGAWAYANSVDGVFVLDDVRAIVHNESIRTLVPIASALAPPPMSTVSGRPFANLTFAVNYAISALDTSSYHLLNILIHLCAGLLFFAVLRRTLLTSRLRDRFGSAATSIAAAAALVWIVHPLTTAAVTYIVQRVESLMSLFYLLTLYCAIRAGDPASGRRRVWTGLSILSCALGMATKEVMVTAPVAVLLWDVVFRRGERPRWALLGGVAASWIVFAILFTGEQRSASMVMTAGTSWRYLLTQSEVLVHYLRLAFVPSPLIFLYSWPLASSIADVFIPVLVITVLLALTIAGAVKRQPLGYAGAWFFLILAPTSSVIPIVTEVAAEHRMYLPLMGIIAAVVCSAFIVLRRWNPRAAAPSVVAGAAIVAILLGAQTRARNEVYASELRIWQDTVTKDPGNQRAHLAYGTALGLNGRLPDAEAEFQRAVDLAQSDPIAQARLGSAQAAQGKFDAAVPHLQRAVAINPADPEANKTLGQIYAMRREDALAAAHLERAMQARPGDPQVLLQLASVLADSDDASVRNPTRGLQLAEEAVRLTSRHEATALDVLGLAYARNGRIVEAIAAARDAMAIARAAGDDAAVDAIGSRLRAYEAARPPTLPRH